MAAAEEAKAEDSSKQAEEDEEDVPILIQWRRQIKELWVEKKRGDPLRQFLIDSVFRGPENPYESILELVQVLPDYVQAKCNGLAASVFREFELWLQSDDGFEVRSRFDDLVSRDLRKRAFLMSTKHHTILFETAIGVYRLKEIGDSFYGNVLGMVKGRNFKDAATVVGAFGLQARFQMEDILIPCLLQDRHNVVEFYVKDNPELQRRLASFLDSLLYPPKRVDEFFQQYNNVEGKRQDKFASKTLQKLIARFIKLFGLPQDVAPNLAKARSEGALRYLVFRRYVEKTVHDENWEDMIKQALDDCPDLRRYLINLLLSNNDIEEAAKWAVRSRMAEAEIPQKVFLYLMDHPDVNALHSQIGAEGRSLVSDNCLCLTLDLDSSVFLVDTKVQLWSMLDQLLPQDPQNSVILGLDTEWRPTFGCSKEKVALLQVSTWTQVFLVDFIALEKELSDEEWIEFIRRFFCSENATKLGFAFDGDLQTLSATIPCIKNELQQIKNIVCLSSLVRKLRVQNSGIIAELDLENQSIAENSDQAANQEDEEGSGSAANKVHFKLSDLCNYVLGKPLDKAEQFSNWARRPLRKAQKHYAALDAYCQLEIYERLRQKSEELGVDFQKAVRQSFVGPPKEKLVKSLGSIHEKKAAHVKKWMEKQELMDIMKHLETKVTGQRSPASVRVVCDKMLGGLGKHLRRCGVDAHILENHDTRETLVELGRRERRIILTSGSAYMAIQNRMPKELCVCLPALKDARSQLAWTLEALSIRLTESDIFSRCVNCNSGEFVFIPGPYLRVIWDSVVATQGVNLDDPMPFDRAESQRRLGEKMAESPKIRITKPRQPVPAPSPGEAEFGWVETFEGGQVDLISGEILGSEPRVKLGIWKIPTAKVIDNQPIFFICRGCGKIYWDGTHLPGYMNGIGHVFEGHVVESPNDTSSDDVVEMDD